MSDSITITTDDDNDTVVRIYDAAEDSTLDIVVEGIEEAVVLLAALVADGIITD